MHSRRFACFLLGLWLGGAIFAAWVGARNTASPREWLDQRGSAAAVLEFKELGARGERALRSHAAEQNRHLINDWGSVQLGLGAALLLYFVFGTMEKKASVALALAMLSAAGLQRLLLAHNMSDVARVLDFAPPEAYSAARAKLAGLRSAHSILEAVKWTAGGALLLKLLWRRRGSGKVREQVEAVDKANYRHIDG